MILWRRRLQIFFTSSMPRTVSSAGSFWQRSVIWRNMVALSFIRAQMTNGNPKRCLYSSLSRSMRDASSDPSASSPAAACSTRDSCVKVPRWRSLPARSGWHLRIPSLPVRQHTKTDVVASSALCLHPWKKSVQMQKTCTWLWKKIDKVVDRSLQRTKTPKRTFWPHCGRHYGAFFHHIAENVHKVLKREVVHCADVHIPRWRRNMGDVCKSCCRGLCQSEEPVALSVKHTLTHAHDFLVPVGWERITQSNLETPFLISPTNSLQVSKRIV